MVKELLKLRNSHTSTDHNVKIKLLLSFKLAVGMNAPAFIGNLQHVSGLISLSSLSAVVPGWKPDALSLCFQDAHEFLTTVLDQISLVVKAASELSVQTVVCPVKKHMQFYVNYVRRCKR